MNATGGLPDEGQLLVAVYQLVSPSQSRAEAVAKLIAAHTYPGTGTTVAGESAENQRDFGGQVLSINAARPAMDKLSSSENVRTFDLRIGFPLQALEDSLAMLLTATAGEVLAYGGLKLVDLELPDHYQGGFRGPKYGVSGLRDRLGVRGRPLILGILKPSLGLTPEQGAASFREAAIGGADIIKDDELLSDPHYSPRSRRVRLYIESEKQAFETSGEHTLYAVNITSPSDRLLTNALEAVDLGANALMVNYLQVGLDATRSICEDPRVTVPVLGHNAGACAIYGSPSEGMSMGLINGKLPRLCGLDMCVLLTDHGKFASRREDCIPTAQEMRKPSGHLRPMLPALGGGVVPATVATLLRDYGSDCAIASGGGLFGHPDGPQAGARAFRQAVGAAMEGSEVTEAARRFPELRAAILKWGA